MEGCHAAERADRLAVAAVVAVVPARIAVGWKVEAEVGSLGILAASGMVVVVVVQSTQAAVAVVQGTEARVRRLAAVRRVRPGWEVVRPARSAVVAAQVEEPEQEVVQA